MYCMTAMIWPTSISRPATRRPPRHKTIRAAVFMPRYTVGWLNAIHRARSDTRVVESLIYVVEAFDFEVGASEENSA